MIILVLYTLNYNRQPRGKIEGDNDELSHLVMRGTIHRRVANVRDDDGKDADLAVVRQRLEYKIRRDGDGDTSSKSAWKLACSLLLTALVLGPLMYHGTQPVTPSREMVDEMPQTVQTSKSKTVGSTKEVHHRDINEFLVMADQLSCAKDLNITYSQIFMDVKLKKTRLCRDPTKRGCRRCKNPTIPAVPNVGVEKGPFSNEAWRAAFARNKGLQAPEHLDVVFLGDSITEGWLGTMMESPNGNLLGNHALWRELGFANHAVPLGIAADDIYSLLYRIQNGEMALNPAAWWIMIGTNDYSHSCAKEVVLAGIVGILEEGLLRKPDARFVLNSILPRGKDNLLKSSMWQDFIWINERMECMVKAMPDQLSYFDAASYFLTSDGTKVNHTLLYDFLHPSTEGYRLWGEGIKANLRELGIWSSSPS